MISCIQNPNACQLYIVPNLVRDGVIESFLTDLETSAEVAMAEPGDLSGRAAVYGMAQVRRFTKLSTSSQFVPSDHPGQVTGGRPGHRLP